MEKNLTNMEEEELKEKELKELSSEELLYRYGKYKMFLADESNDASPVFGDVDSECKLIYSILLGRLSEAEGE